MKEIDIIGTCLTRELFNYTKEYKVKTYIMQQSIYTINSNPYPIKQEDIELTDNFKFKVRMVYYDFNKIAFQQLSVNPSEYLIVDLADQIRNLVILDDFDNIRLIATSSIIEVLSKLNIKYHIYDIDSLTNEEIYFFMQQFIEIILSLYDSKKIILNKVQLKNEYYENNEKKYIDESILVYRRKKTIEKMEKIFVNLIPDCKILETKYEPILDINHRLGGPHPGHFEEIYYKYKMELLDRLIKGQETEEVNENYEKEYDTSIKLIRNKKITTKRC